MYVAKKIENLIENLIENNIIDKSIIHKSYDENNIEFERLEYLGDKILGVNVSLKIYYLFSFANSGKLTLIFSKIVSNDNLKETVEKLNLASKFKYKNDLGKKMTADFLEAIIGELYMKKRYEEMQLIIDYIIYNSIGIYITESKEDNQKHNIIIEDI